MRVEAVSAADDPRLRDYADTRAPGELRRRGLFIAESREVVAALIRTRRFRVRSLFLTGSMLEALAGAVSLLDDATPVYLGDARLMTSVAGYTVHRGCLAAGERGDELSLEDLMRPPGGVGAPGEPGVPAAPVLVVALEAVSNPDNVGGIFRNALGFGAGGVVLGPGSGDPLYRKCIRTSMAASLRVPFACVPDLPRALRSLRGAGFTVAALSPKGPAEDLRKFAAEPVPRLVLLLGSEGQGLSAEALAETDVRVRIPMAPGVDSLNVSVAAGIALHELASSRGLLPG